MMTFNITRIATCFVANHEWTFGHFHCLPAPAEVVETVPSGSQNGPHTYAGTLPRPEGVRLQPASRRHSRLTLQELQTDIRNVTLRKNREQA
jgi:hypothetical protein